MATTCVALRQETGGVLHSIMVITVDSRSGRLGLGLVSGNLYTTQDGARKISTRGPSETN